MYKGMEREEHGNWARVVIQVSSTPELPGERGKCLLKIQLSGSYQMTELEFLRARPL